MDEAQWLVVFYKSASGNIPVKEFLEKLSSPLRAKILYGLTMLSSAGYNLGPPWLKKIDDILWEIRIQAEKTQVRVLFCEKKRKFILLHALKKKRQKRSRQDIETAHQRWDDYKVRMK